MQIVRAIFLSILALMQPVLAMVSIAPKSDATSAHESCCCESHQADDSSTPCDENTPDEFSCCCLPARVNVSVRVPTTLVSVAPRTQVTFRRVATLSTRPAWTLPAFSSPWATASLPTHTPVLSRATPRSVLCIWTT